MFGGSNDGETASAETQCYLILPNCDRNDNAGSKDTEHDCRTSNECAICMTEYDVGDVITFSKHCRHAFHQACILDWFSWQKSRGDCPTCRKDFRHPNNDSKKKTPADENSSRAVAGIGNVEGRSVADRAGRIRSDTADTDALSELDSRSREPSFDGIHNDNAADAGLPTVTERNDPVEVSP